MVGTAEVEQGGVGRAGRVGCHGLSLTLARSFSQRSFARLLTFALALSRASPYAWCLIAPRVFSFSFRRGVVVTAAAIPPRTAPLSSCRPVWLEHQRA